MVDDSATAELPLIKDTLMYGSPVPTIIPESFVSVFALPPRVSDIVNSFASIILSIKY